MSTARAAWSIFRNQGARGVVNRVAERLAGTTGIARSAVRYVDATSVDWSQPHPAVLKPFISQKRNLTFAWIMSPPGESSGGHQNIFRFIKYLEEAGHQSRIYLYSVDPHVPVGTIKRMLAASSAFPNVSATIELYPEGGIATGADALFATGWETAYPAFRDATPARRLYFVQDFEPFFYPVGTYSVLAENTYRFGFTGVTAGRWLAAKLAEDYGMQTHSFDFSANRSDYNFTNEGQRNEIFFYVRPGTARRGFELGLMALALFAKERPQYTINLGGWDVSRYSIPFAHVNLKSMPIHDLNAVYNRCAAGLVLSMTNMSLLPLELLASGVIPVVNEADNNVMVSSNPFIEYSAPSPRALADRLIAVVDRADLPAHAAAGAASLGEGGWDGSGAQFVAAVEGVMRG